MAAMIRFSQAWEVELAASLAVSPLELKIENCNENLQCLALCQSFSFMYREAWLARGLGRPPNTIERHGASSTKTYFLRVVKPMSPWGPSITKQPNGLRWKMGGLRLLGVGDGCC